MQGDVAGKVEESALLGARNDAERALLLQVQLHVGELEDGLADATCVAVVPFVRAPQDHLVEELADEFVSLFKST